MKFMSRAVDIIPQIGILPCLHEGEFHAWQIVISMKLGSALLASSVRHMETIRFVRSGLPCISATVQCIAQNPCDEQCAVYPETLSCWLF